MRDAQVRKVPRELRAEGGVVVGLNLLDGKGKMFSNLAQELDRRFSVVVVVDSQHAETCRFIDSRELVEALTSSSDAGNKFHIELHGPSRDVERSVSWLRARTIFLLRDRPYVVTAKEFVDGCWQNTRVVVPLEVEAGSNRTIAALFPNPEDQGNDLRRNPVPDVVRPPFQIAQAS